MQYISTKKYKSACIMYVVMFLFALLLGVSFGAVKDAIWTGLAVGGVLGIFFLAPAAHYLYFGIVCAKKAKTVSPVFGMVVDAKAGAFIKGLGSVAIKTGNKQYRTPTYFWFTEAQSLVGHKVSYCLIKNEVFIFGIVEEN